jgi:hypothetical protein
VVASSALLQELPRPARELFVAVIVVDAAVIGLHLVSELSGAYAQIFNLDAEQNLPTWLSSLQFAMVAAGAFLAGRTAAGSTRLAWWVLSGVFLFLSADETATVHEKLAAHVDLPVPKLPVIFSPLLIATAISLPFVSRDVRRALGTAGPLLAAFALLGLSLFLDAADVQALDTSRFRPLIVIEEASELVGTALVATLAVATFVVRVSDSRSSPSHGTSSLPRD